MKNKAYPKLIGIGLYVKQKLMFFRYVEFYYSAAFLGR
jgi:hypothetical protein